MVISDRDVVFHSREDRSAAQIVHLTITQNPQKAAEGESRSNNSHEEGNNKAATKSSDNMNHNPHGSLGSSGEEEEAEPIDEHPVRRLARPRKKTRNLDAFVIYSVVTERGQPNTFKEAIQGAEPNQWREAMQREYGSRSEEQHLGAHHYPSRSQRSREQMGVQRKQLS